MPETIVSRFLENADRLGTRPAAVYHTGSLWTPLSWQAAGSQVRNIAAGFMEAGLKKGDCVAILADTRVQWLMVDLGNLCAGGITVGVYPTMTADQSGYIIAHCDARFVMVDTKAQLDKVLSVRDQLPKLEKIIVIEASAKSGKDVITLEELSAQGKASSQDIDKSVANLTLEDAATFIYTSGTTGPPKGAMLTHGNIVAALGMLNAIPMQESDAGFAFLPFAHSLQRMVSYHGIWHGVQGKFARSLDTLADDLQICAPSLVASVPRIFEKIYAAIHKKAQEGSPTKSKIFNWALSVGGQVSKLRQSHEPIPTALGIQYRIAKKLVFNKLRQKLGGKIRIFVTGGAPIAREILEFFDAADITILEGWGLTETTAAGTINLPGAQRFGSIGRPLAGVEMRLDDDGEMLIRGGQVFGGYHKDEEATKAAFTSDGYFRTGDIGRIDADGYYYIIDRKKDILITAGGKNVAPQNIENLLKTDPLISQVMVVGDRQPYLTALISVTPEVRAEQDDAALYVLLEAVVAKKNEQLASYERIRKFRLLPEDLTQETGELTPTLKVKRNVVREKYNKLIEDMYAEPKKATSKPHGTTQ